MPKKLLVSLATFAAVCMTAPAMAQPNVQYFPDPAVADINIHVEEIAELIVTDAVGNMYIDNSYDTHMGNPSSLVADGGTQPFATGDWAAMRLNTNFTVTSVNVDFDQVANIRRRENPAWPANSANFNGTGFDYFGRALCTSGPCTPGATLGVFPQIWSVNETTNTFFGTPGQRAFATLGAPLILNGPGHNGAGFPNNTYLMGLGVSTNWSRTLLGEPLFAAPGTYHIALTATIIP